MNWIELKKRLIGKLLLPCEDEIYNPNQTSLDNKIAICRNNCLIHTNSLLNVISIGSSYCYEKYHKSQKHLLPYNDTSNKLKWIDSYNLI